MNMNNDLTLLLSNSKAGDQVALNLLVEKLYPMLKTMASGFMRRESSGHTLQATAVVNEAYSKLFSSEIDWQDRAHFLGMASTVMRRILVDHARAKKSVKRGGESLTVTYIDDITSDQVEQANMLDIDDALSELSDFDPVGAEILQMRIFSGMTMQEIATAMGVSLSSVERQFRSVRAWLFTRLSSSQI